MAIVYSHTRLDKNEVFYIGIGNNHKRAYNKIDRSDFWKKIVNKTDYTIQILMHNCSFEDAKTLEIYFINLYKRKDKKEGTLCNLTDGGEGCTGRTVSKATRKKMRNARLGKKLSKEHCINIGNSKRGLLKSDSFKKKISEGNKKSWTSSNDRYNSILKANGKKVIDTITGIIYLSCKEVADKFNLKYSTLRSRLNGGLCNNTNFKYLTT